MKQLSRFLLALAIVVSAGCSTVSSSSSFPLQYQNADYGFAISLPSSWKGYAIITKTWDGHSAVENANSEVIEHGPLLTIRHPQWTAQAPLQDIPIYVYTLKQWSALDISGGFVVHSSGIEDELYHNSHYVFVVYNRDLIPDFNDENIKGAGEVARIVQNLEDQHPEVKRP